MKATSIRAWTAKDSIRAILAGLALGGELQPYQRRAITCGTRAHVGKLLTRQYKAMIL